MAPSLRGPERERVGKKGKQLGPSPWHLSPPLPSPCLCLLCSDVLSHLCNPPWQSASECLCPQPQPGGAVPTCLAHSAGPLFSLGEPGPSLSLQPSAGSALPGPGLMDAFLGLQIQAKKLVLEPSDGVPFDPARWEGTRGWALAEGAVHRRGGVRVQAERQEVAGLRGLALWLGFRI